MANPTLIDPAKCLGREVFVYRNLTRKCYSVKDVATGRVIQHAQEVGLANVTFKVSAKVRDRMRLTRKKEVHAGIVGQLYWILPVNGWAGEEKTYGTWVPLKEHIGVSYNPYVNLGFVTSGSPCIDDNVTVICASRVFCGRNVTAESPISRIN